MELIKQIKECEAQAQQIVEQAKTEAAGRAEKERRKRQQALQQAEQNRREAVEKAAAQAQLEGLKEVERLKADAQHRCRQLHDKAKGRIDAAVAKVTSYIRG